MLNTTRRVIKLLVGHPIQCLSAGIFITCTGIAYTFPEKVYGWYSKKTIKDTTMVKQESKNKCNTSCETSDSTIEENVNHAEKPQEEFNDKIRIILLGATGAGKSSAGNVLLNKDVFKTSYFAKSFTKTSQKESVNSNPFTVEIIDTPAVLDTEQDEHDIEKQLENAVTLASPGPHAFLLCIPSTSITNYYIDCFEKYQHYFDDTVEHFVIVAFTRYNQFEMTCNNESKKKEIFEKEVSRALEKENSNLKKIKNVKKDHIILSIKSEDALNQVIDIIKRNTNELKKNKKKEYARCKQLYIVD